VYEDEAELRIGREALRERYVGFFTATPTPTPNPGLGEM
jgi:hypothetical protein